MSAKDLQEAITLVDLAHMGIEAALKAKKNKMTLTLEQKEINNK